MRIVIGVMVLLLVAGGAAAAPGEGRVGDLLLRQGVAEDAAGDLTRSHRGAVNAGLDDNRLEGMIRQSLQNGFDPAQISRLLVVLTEAAVNGLPVAPLFNKIGEGLAKHARDEDVVEAVEKRALAFARARKVVGAVIYDRGRGERPESLLVAVGMALERGVGEREIEDRLKGGATDLKKVILEVEKMR
jgi:hypothetical protein